MKIELTILSPVHIGSGEEISPIEYFIDGNKFIRIDIDGLFNDPLFKPQMDKFIEQAKNKRYIGELLQKDLLLSHPLYSLDISYGARNCNPIAVKGFIKSAGRVYIPGSSLKGSILSAVIWKKAKEKNIRDFRDIQNVVIGSISKCPLNSCFSRWLDISDSDFKHPQDSLELSLAKIERATRGSSYFQKSGQGWEFTPAKPKKLPKSRSQPILYETLKSGLKFTMEIKTGLKLENKNIDKFGNLSEIEILKICDEFYRKVYEKEKGFTKQKLPAIPSNSFLLRLGQGSTCLSTSFLLLAEDIGNRNYKICRPSIGERSLPPIKIGETPWTRKLISGIQSMGWAYVIQK